MRVIVTQRSEAIEFFLPGGIPEGKLDVDIVDEDVMDVVLEDRRFTAIAMWLVDGAPARPVCSRMGGTH